MENIDDNKKHFFRNVIIKTIILLIIVNFGFAFLAGIPFGRLTLYNHVYFGRERFPFGEDPTHSYNLSIYNLDAMFSSLVLNSVPKGLDEFRVLLVGDSSVWGSLLRNSETLSGQINLSNLTCNGKQVMAYNLGYPTLSVFKDLMVIDQSLKYNPDLIIWLFTLESFPLDNQISNPLIENNAYIAENIIQKYGLSNPDIMSIKNQNYWDKTIIGQRRNLADLIRLQLYGFMWAATGIDQTIPDSFTPALRDFNYDASFHGMEEHNFEKGELALDILSSTATEIQIPIVFVNEPILISEGENSSIRYNYYYPRWAYDQYRTILSKNIQTNKLTYYDFWDIIPNKEFTNSAIHLTPVGEKKLASLIGDLLKDDICNN